MRKASTEGIAIQGQQGSRLLPEQLLTEAFILSDLFDIGELAALELLLAGNMKGKPPNFIQHKLIPFHLIGKVSL